MNERIKKLWVDALRSGKYTQSKHTLRTVSGFCCLGVLCDIAAEDAELGEWVLTTHGWVFAPSLGRGSSEDVLPSVVQEWAGLNQGNPLVRDGSLAYRNDHGSTFADIADIIESEL